MTAAFATLVGGIDTLVVRKLCAFLGAANADGCDSIHIAMASAGGSPLDALHAYEMMLALQIPITVHATGPVGSAALIIYLGGDRRLSVEDAWFFSHPVTIPIQAEVSVQRAADLGQQVGLLDDALNNTLANRTIVSAAQLAQRRMGEIVWRAADAKASGIIHDVQSYQLPTQTMVHSIGC